MTYNLKSKRRADPVLSKFRNTGLGEIVSTNLSYPSTRRILTREFGIKDTNLNYDYLISEDFKWIFLVLTEENKVLLCKTLAGIRGKELRKKIEDNKE